MKPSHLLRKGTFALALGFGFAASLLTPSATSHAQSLISGDIAGTVVDASGAAISGASVTITNNETGAVTTATSSGSGTYHGSLLKPGHYTVLVTAPNFQSAQTATEVAVGQTATANVTLSVGSGTQTVKVEATAVSLLQPENADLGTTIDLQQVQNLPNPGGDITYFINLTQGVIMNTQGGYGNSSAFGLPATSNNFTVNGAEDNDPFLNLNNSGPSNLLLGSNDVSEVNIVGNAYSAQYGSLGGVQENIITRSGSNSFHGNATYWWTNSDMNANDWFNDNQGAVEPFSNANQWGAAIGGPIFKDKTFFFANYEGLRFVTAPADRVFLPNASYEASVLSDLQTANPAEIPFYQQMFNLYNNAPGAATATPGGAQPFYPNGYFNVLEENPKNDLSEVLVTARLDQKIGPNDNAFMHFKYDHGVQPTYVDPINPNFNAHSDQPDWEGQLEETHTFSPNVVNQFLFATSWYSAYFTSVNQSLATSTFPYELEWADGSFNNLGGIDLAWPEGRNVTQYQFSEDLSWTKGKHTMSFGGIFKRADTTDADLGVLTTPLGAEFGPAEASAAYSAAIAKGATPAQASAAAAPNDLYTAGLMLEGVENFPTRLTEPIALYNLGVYAQDQWKILPNVLLTAGVRVEHNSNPTCITSCFAHFDDSYNNINDTLDTPYNSIVKNGLHTAFTNLQKVGIDPRVGFTYSPPDNSKIVIRGGFGMFTDIFPATTADSLLDNAPLNPEFAVLFDNADPAVSGSFTSALSSVNQTFLTGFPAGGSYNSLSAANPNFATAPPNVFNPDKNIHSPTYEEWSLQYQQQIGKYTSFQVGYVGNHGYHTPILNNGVNIAESVTEGPFTGLPATQALPGFGSVTEVSSVGTSNYSGLLATVKHDSKSLTLLFNYGYSHALDEVSNGGFLNFGGNGIHPVDPFNIALQNYGNADYDIRQNMNGSYLYHIPSFGGPKLLTDGWQISGTVFYHTGFPFSVVDSIAANNLNTTYYGGAVLAQITNTSVPHHCGKQTVNSCFGANPSMYFADPTQFGGPGSQTRNQFFGPGYFNTDFALTKSFAIPKLESGHFQIGAQAYNVLNHPDFGNPGFDFDNGGTFGLTQGTVSVPTSVYGSFLGGDASARILQLKAKFDF